MSSPLGARAALLTCLLLCTSRAWAAQIAISWEDNATGETGFKVERALDGVSFSQIAIVPANTLKHIDGTTESGTTYFYRIAAIDTVGASKYSESVKVTTSARPSSAPTGTDPVVSSPASDSSVTPPSSTASSNPLSSRLVNLSVRAVPGPGERALFVGFVVGSASKAMLVRAVGPGLSTYTTASVFSDPKLAIYDGANAILTNDNWGGTEPLKTAFSRLGAFPLLNGSKDAAIVSTLAPKSYTASVTGSGEGLTLAEIYDADAGLLSTGRLVNVSARAHAGPGDGVLIVGFVISGNTPMRVLVRGVGAALSNYGVVDVLTNPQIHVYQGNTLLQHNDDWSGSTELKIAFAQVGAFALPDGSSKDAAAIVTLSPGAYTVIVSGVGGTSGVALAEVYELR